ncbi:DUF1109 domain-containing protein [Aurantiacibacter hainanensis]|uniref:DUF1109 domain-containing protein n=1 Tax=Aurantiacibacter hainanensis TaxID=3076114 RepID=UPI0030C73E45
MRQTETLIDSLAHEGGAPPAGALARFAGPLVVAALLCALGVSLVLEGAFSSSAINGYAPIFVKWGFSIALVLLSGSALWAIGHPGKRTGGALIALSVPFILVAILLALDLAVGERTFPGETWRRCLSAMTIMSPLAFAGAIMATRWLAPTNLRLAGLAAGLFGGAVAMTAYSPYCPELGMAYMAVFYCLPILAMAGIGWMIGPRLLRW